ncbi:MAG: hypothetical protein R3A44_43230 [Caldilineaceae bacterium]
MTTAHNHQSSLNPDIGELDDLTKIKGIGPVRQEWLRETFDVCKYQDLAALSPEEIESQLQAEGRAASRNEIKTWITQAQDLADSARRAQMQTTRLATAATQRAANPPLGLEKDWRPIASFAVEFQERIVEDAEFQMRQFQTTVHHMEADSDAMWTGIESERLCKWMLEELDYEARLEIAGSRAVETTPTP